MKKLMVGFDFGVEQFAVGELVDDNGRILFQYDADFLRTSLDISPFRLRRIAEPQLVNVDFFDGLFGVFADSLPDGWERLLMDRLLREQAIDASEINILDKLAYVGISGMGALTFHPANEVQCEDMSIDLDAIAKASSEVLKGESVEVIERLVRLAGSSGGARPKVTALYHEERDELMSNGGGNARLSGFSEWLIKFP